ncbi:thymidine kinase [Alicyclobacillus mengziensis]|uniref:Thymidine kinase n=1 Tax=Alicyclobacillus mengziensis TaxID=2931921 RepID=A0A9X7VUB5_9BACL|nr:thymidine kinase [Alicyclobacillus mengziensis]QSO45373.1 thymidine kinase [Alicyclobacillus mengziensis]
MFDTKSPDVGHLLAITGNMMSGKTEELIARIRTFERVEAIRVQAAKREGTRYKRRKIGVYKHGLDTRYSDTEIASHSGQRMQASLVESAQALYEDVIKNGYGIVACDEVQFFMEKDDDGYVIIKVLAQLLRRRCLVVVSGLDKDFRGMPFGPMGDILALADERVSLTSTCVRCGAPAVLPQRLINGRPADWNDPIVFPGATEAYEPRCRRCHVTFYSQSTELNPADGFESIALAKAEVAAGNE